MKIHTIAALTDFSTEAEHALDRAALLGAKHQAQLILVYGAESPDPRFANPQARLEQRARQIARRHSITVTTREYEGSVAERALQAAASADLLVVDRRMEREWTRFWQGPTLAHCLRNSPCPVLVVQQSAETDYERMVIAVDGSRASQDLVRYAGDLQRSAAVDLYHAAAQPTPPSAANAQSGTASADSNGNNNNSSSNPLALYQDTLTRHGKSRRLRIKNAFDARRNRVDTHLGTRDMPRQLMVQQQRSGADLVVIGQLRTGFLASWTFSGIAERLLGQVACDVLVCANLPTPRDNATPTHRSAFPSGRLPA